MANLGLELSMIIRNETDSDIELISDVTKAAFENHPISNHTEQFVINALRAANALTISLVAEIDGAGHPRDHAPELDGLARLLEDEVLALPLHEAELAGRPVQQTAHVDDRLAREGIVVGEHREPRSWPRGRSRLGASTHSRIRSTQFVLSEIEWAQDRSYPSTAA